MLGQAVNLNGIAPFQLIDQSRGHFQFPLQKGGQSPIPSGHMLQFQKITSKSLYFSL
jgi:hypothetical protein